MPHVLAFVGLAALIVALPGPATALVTTNTLRGGRGAGLWTAAGLLAADLLWATLTVIGLTALLVSSQTAFDVIRLIGAAYLVFFGIRLLLTRDNPDDRPSPAGSARRSTGRAFRQGLVCNLSNPKTLLVFTSVVPQMAPSGAGAAVLGVYGAVFALVGFGSSLTYALIFTRVRRASGRPAVRRLILRLSGLVIVGFGLRLMTERS